MNHTEAALALLSQADDSTVPTPNRTLMLLAAQVHATLALQPQPQPEKPVSKTRKQQVEEAIAAKETKGV